mmetsp:Transcript_10287/g.15637  ORF Transcript_10287/g.15637 Transcript_10287/m.15637 type:complete len:1291 (-) Transcript_10287:104-3976(-)
MKRQELFQEICSQDFLQFSFSGRSYQDQLYDSIAKTKQLAGVQVELITIQGIQQSIQCIWVTHVFSFMGGSLGCAEGEKITRAFEYAKDHHMPICVQCKTGGARMQEGTSSLMQMAKVSVAVEALKREGLPFISVLCDPTYGGVSASYAMQADVRIGVSASARIGFAGPQVILNTMCEANQERFDSECPADFQSASYVAQYGQLDMIMEDGEGGKPPSQTEIEDMVGRIASLLCAGAKEVSPRDPRGDGYVPPSEEDTSAPFNYTRSRMITRPQTQDIVTSVFDNFVELYGDGKVGRDACIRGGIASFEGLGDYPCVLIATFKGHTPTGMQDTNYGMASPHGYRTALRLMQLAERFGLPVVTMVDTVGAWPTFDCERDGQSEAIASNLTAMAGLRVPIVTLLVGEGGSGGALGIGMGNSIGMLSGGYFGVISPEGAASILGRYKDDAHKAEQFPKDCQELAVAQCIYANQLKDIGVVDEIIWEKYSKDGEEETHEAFPVLRSRIRAYLIDTLANLMRMSPEELVAQRYNKFRAMGLYEEILSEEDRKAAVELASKRSGGEAAAAKRKAARLGANQSIGASKLIQHIAEETMGGTWSRYRKLCPADCPTEAPHTPVRQVPEAAVEGFENAKSVLDANGPEALAVWARKQSKVLVTDTTMRDAHQSLLATRVRTEDLVKGARCASDCLKSAFSLECWGGATFDVSMRFLDECPWKRLREIRAACPNVCLQMLVRGSNAVGYTSYPDNVVAEFIRLAAVNGMDVFRIFDCFNDVDSMKVSIDAVRAANKVAEVCLCYTGNLLTSKIYDVNYYREVARLAVEAGAHIIGIKDMAGLLRPQEAGPLLEAIRSVIPETMPIHFHTHSTSSGAIATCMEMARQGCDIVDTCTAAMADGTSQPSMNAFVAMMEGADNATGMSYLDLEGYDMYWARVRSMYKPFESGMLSGSARVYEHQIPGGQYSNLLVQCHSMGLWDRWEEVLDAYRDSNRVLGDIIKVTPSSKCVGDLALYLVTRNLSAADLLDTSKASSIDFPESVVGLLRGDLGFPHKGFPESVEKAVLRGAPKRTVRAGITLPPEDLEANIAALSAQWGVPISEEEGMSSLMYPKVFSDYMKRQQSKGGELLRHLPSPVYFYGMVPGQSFTMTAPSSLLMTKEGEAPLLLPSGAGPVEATGYTQVSIKLERITPLKGGMRDLIFSVNGMKQVATVRDTSGAFVFDGPMVNSSDPKQLGSPMPGVVEKVLVEAGQTVSAGETLCTVSAMKMEVKVTAPSDGVVSSLSVEVGTRVVEGALLVTMQ